jgi:4-hydroxyphenylpyruvate dioxygenase
MDEVRRTEPECRLTAPAMPPRVPVAGVEFVEFTAQGAEADELKATLKSLGFQPAGTHRSKPATLWRQGAVNFVVNEATEGQAAAAFALHGTSVCDIGLKVGDARAVRARAAALLADVFDPDLPEGDMAIPAIRAPGGGVLHFLDDTAELRPVWDAEFHARPGGTGAGLTRIDHLAVTMAYDEMLTHALFYTSVLDVAKSGVTDVIDPAGLVRSQVIESPDGGLRLTMNGADSHRTVAGRMLTEAAGSAVSHVALATDDIIATAEALNRLGFRALAIPGNYYDDLEARLGIDTSDLRRWNLLMEREGGAEFLQLYGRTLGDRFFFEIVERRGGYSGYGALNAPVRTAAQRRLMAPPGMPRR